MKNNDSESARGVANPLNQGSEASLGKRPLKVTRRRSPVSCAPDSRLPVVARGRLEAVGRLYLYQHDERAHVWKQKSQLMSMQDTTGVSAPLQIIRSRILVFAIRAERTHIARRLMHEAMADHFVFALEALAALGARAALHGAVVRSVLRVHIRMRAREHQISICDREGLGRLAIRTLADTASETAAHCTRDNRIGTSPDYAGPLTACPSHLAAARLSRQKQPMYRLGSCVVAAAQSASAGCSDLGRLSSDILRCLKLNRAWEDISRFLMLVRVVCCRHRRRCRPLSAGTCLRVVHRCLRSWGRMH